MTHPKQLKKSLFIRIVLQLTIPLILLATLLTALQVSIQLISLNKINQTESRWIFSAFDQKIRDEFKSSKSENDMLRLDQRCKSNLSEFNVSEISFFNYLKNSPVNSNDTWTSFDLKEIEKAILKSNQDDKKHHVAVNRQTRQLSAYIPLSHPDSDSIYIARATILLSDFKTAINKSQAYLTFMFLSILIVGIIMGYGFSNSIIRPIELLSRASRNIALGKLGEKVTIRTGDELEILAQTFNEMSQALQEMKKNAVDSNPLTGLPGNHAIFHELKKRIFERQKFVLFHADLDRFKVFNDHYGLAKGDEAIRKTAELLKSCMAEKGAQDDYIGHQGGDDYVIITRPNRAQALAEHIVANFDKKVVAGLYAREDIERGYTIHEDRRYYTETGEHRNRNFPLLAISLAGISTAKKDLADFFHCMALVAQIKKEAKKTVVSSFFIKEDF